MSQLLDKILSSENMRLAYKKVKANKGASGVEVHGDGGNDQDFA